MTCAASPTRKTRRSVNRSATSATARQTRCPRSRLYRPACRSRSDEGNAALLVDSLRDIERVGSRHVAARHHSEEARVSGPHQPEEPAQVRIEDIDHTEIPAAQGRAAIGVEIDRNAFRQMTGTARGDAEPVADRAAVAVGRDHVFGADCVGLAADHIPDEAGDAVGVLFERYQFGRIKHRRAQLLGAVANERFEALLGHEQAGRGTDCGDTFIEVGDVGRNLLAGERLDGVDAAVRIELLLRCRLDAGLKPDRAQHLERAQVKMPGARMDGGAMVALDRERRHAMPGEKACGGKPDQAAADDQHVGFDHLRSPRFRAPAEHDPEKWKPVFGKDHALAQYLAHDPIDRVAG